MECRVLVEAQKSHVLLKVIHGQRLLRCMAGKMKLRIRDEQIMREMTLEGVASILEGMNPRMFETKLLGFLVEANQREREEEDEVGE